MKHINIVYDDVFDDADILLVPDFIADHITAFVKQFWKWLSIPENQPGFVLPNEKGEIIFNIDTEEFLWWLNNVAIDSDVKAVIVKRHTLFVPEYPTAEF